MVNVGGVLHSRRRLRAIVPSAFALMLGVCTPAAFADAAPSPNGDTKVLPGLSPEVAKLVQDATAALNSGNLNLALIQLKNAVRAAPNNGDVRAQLGLALLRGNQAVAAERELRQARNDKASDEVVVPGILQAMLLRNETKDLLAEFREAPAGASDKLSADIFQARAIAQQATGQTAEAKASMEKALRLKRDPGYLVNGAKLARQQGDFVLARTLIDEARKAAPANEEAVIVDVLLLRQNHTSDKAVPVLDDFLKQAPKSIVARIMRIDVLQELNQDAKAKEDVEALLKMAPNSLYGHYYRGVLMARAKDYKGAWQEMQNLRPEFVQSEPNIAMMVASVASFNGNSETAGSILTTVVAKHPDVAAARLQLATLRLAQKSPASALDTLAPLKGSSDALVHTLLAQAYLQLRRYDEAIASLEIATKSQDKNDFLKRQLALSELEAGDTNKAIQGLQDLAQRNPENPNLAAPLIAALVKSGKSDEALRVIDRLEKASKKSPAPAFLRGQVLSSRGDLAGATEAYGQALVNDPKYLPALYYRANLQIGRGNIDDASKDLRQILALDPNNMQAYSRLAEIALSKDQEPQAIALLEQAIKVAPKNPAPRLALVNLQMSRAKYQEAQATVIALLQAIPNNPEALALKGQIEFLQGARADAVNTYRTLASGNAQSSGAYILLARMLSATKDQVGAEDAAKRAVELDPKSVTARSTLIDVQFVSGKAENALATARAFVMAAPGSQSDLVLADTLYRAKRVNEASAVLEKSLASKPDPQIVVRMSQLAAASGDTKKAVAIFANWLAKNPDDYAIRVQYGSLLAETGNEAAARREYETLLKQRPENPVVLNNLGWSLQKEDPARALTLVSRASKISPRSPEIADTLGWLKFQQRDNQGALPLFQRAHNLDPNSAAIAYHLALALDANGKRVEAKTLLQATLEKNPKFAGAEDAKQVLARW